MNKLNYNLLGFALNLLVDWEDEFKVKPEVWVGLFRPQYKLNDTQRLVAKVAVKVARVLLEEILEAEDTKNWGSPNEPWEYETEEESENN